MDTKHTQQIHHHLPFPYAHPSSQRYPPQEKSKDWLFLPALLFFLKCILIVQGCFSLLFQDWIYCASVKLIPFPTTYSFSYHHAPLIFNSSLYSSLC
jgi:hypothetical protein